MAWLKTVREAHAQVRDVDRRMEEILAAGGPTREQHDQLNRESDAAIAQRDQALFGKGGR